MSTTAINKPVYLELLLEAIQYAEGRNDLMGTLFWEEKAACQNLWNKLHKGEDVSKEELDATLNTLYRAVNQYDGE